MHEEKQALGVRAALPRISLKRSERTSEGKAINRQVEPACNLIGLCGTIQAHA